MGFLMRLWPIIATGALLCACATTPVGPLSLQEQLEHPKTINLALVETSSDVLLVNAGLSDGSQATFVIDTGATLSSIFPNVQMRLGLVPSEDKSIRVHGMTATKLQPVTTLPGLNLGGTELAPLSVAIIPRAGDSDGKPKLFPDADYDGIIGMDVLSQYHFYIHKVNKSLSLIPRKLGPPRVPREWDSVELTRNPFLKDNRELHFFQLHIGSTRMPALLDTGSQFNMMNWNTQRFPGLRAIERRLKKNWEISGAVGSFQPITKIKSDSAQSGEKTWGRHDFIVLNFESLDVLGIDGKPFVIAGMPMIDETGVLIDFENDRLYFAPDGRRRMRTTLY